MSPIESTCGPMECGKSEDIFRRLGSLEAVDKQVGREILIFTYSGDDRFGIGKITTRAYGGMQRDAIAIQTAQDMVNYLNQFPHIDKLEYIFIDEAAFLKDNQEDLVNILQGLDEELGLNIYLYFLDTDYKDHPIGHAGALAIIAKDGFHRLSSFCSHKSNGATCGNIANYTSRFTPDGNPEAYDAPVEVIGHKQYTSRCKLHKQRPGKPQLEKYGFTNNPATSS